MTLLSTLSVQFWPLLTRFKFCDFDSISNLPCLKHLSLHITPPSSFQKILASITSIQTCFWEHKFPGQNLLKVFLFQTIQNKSSLKAFLILKVQSGIYLVQCYCIVFKWEKIYMTQNSLHCSFSVHHSVAFSTFTMLCNFSSCCWTLSPKRNPTPIKYTCFHPTPDELHWDCLDSPVLVVSYDSINQSVFDCVWILLMLLFYIFIHIIFIFYIL